MSQKTKDISVDQSTEFVNIVRMFKAPRALVFKAWTDPEHLKRWYAPRGCTITYRSIDVRDGGKFHYCIHNPTYGDCWCIGTYIEIVAPEKIIFTLCRADADGNLREPVEVGMDPAWPKETVVTLTFRELNGQTEVTLHQTVSASLAKRNGAHLGWLEMLDKLAEDLHQ